MRKARGPAMGHKESSVLLALQVQAEAWEAAAETARGKCSQRLQTYMDAKAAWARATYENARAESNEKVGRE